MIKGKLRGQQERTCLIDLALHTFMQASILIIYNDLQLAPFHKEFGDEYFSLV